MFSIGGVLPARKGTKVKTANVWLGSSSKQAWLTEFLTYLMIQFPHPLQALQFHLVMICITTTVSKVVTITSNATKKIIIRLNGTGKYTVHPKGCGLVANKPLLLLVMVV